MTLKKENQVNIKEKRDKEAGEREETIEENEEKEKTLITKDGTLIRTRTGCSENMDTVSETAAGSVDALGLRDPTEHTCGSEDPSVTSLPVERCHKPSNI